MVPGVALLRRAVVACHLHVSRGRHFFVHNLLPQIHFIIVMIRWTGLAPWEFEFPFSGSLVSTFSVSWVCGVPSLPVTCAFV